MQLFVGRITRQPDLDHNRTIKNIDQLPHSLISPFSVKLLYHLSYSSKEMLWQTNKFFSCFGHVSRKTGFSHDNRVNKSFMKLVTFIKV